MAEGDKISYSDIIQPDDSIEKLVGQLGELTKQYDTMIGAIRAGADRITQALKATSGATTEGRKSIEDAANSTSRLERAQKELKLALSDTGKQIAWLKAQTADANRMTVEQQRYVKQAVSSYDRLKSDLREMVNLYRSLTAAERDDSQMGKQLISDIMNLTKQVQALDAAMKPHIQTLSAVEKAEQKLAYLQSAEGQQLLALKAKIAEITRARKQQKASIDPLVAAQERLAYAHSYENQQLKLYSTQISEANRIAKLQVQIASSAEGSYNRLAAQYELNKIKLNQMSGAQRAAADGGKKLEAETIALYEQMRKLQEATGSYKLSVGHYQRTWDGLGISVSNVVRELPAAAVSLNTFFLGISNNIPILVDEINRLRAQNKAFQAEGKPTVSITKEIVKSLLSWNTVLVVGLTVLSTYGKQIIEWAGSLFKAKGAAISFEEAQKNLNEELKTNNANYGANVVALKRLQREWQKLEIATDKAEWIEANQSAFEDLGFAIEDATDAENVFVNNTEAVLAAFRARAKAAAAEQLAIKSYEKAFIKRTEAEALVEQGPTGGMQAQASIGYISTGGTGPSGGYTQGQQVQNTAQALHEQKVADLNAEATAAEAAADAYFDLQAGYEAEAAAILKAANIKASLPDDPDDPDDPRKPRTPRQRDLTDTVNRMAISVQEKYERSITALERNEYAKRRKEAIGAANAEIRELEETYRKNVDYLNDTENKYKDLTAEEIALVQEAQQRIRLTITNTQERLNHELELIEKDRQISELKLTEETIQLRLDAVKKGSEEELQLRMNAIEAAREIALLENSKLPGSQQQSEATINAGFNKQLDALLLEFEMTAFEQQQELEQARFDEVKRSEKEITRFRLEQEKARWEKQIQLAEKGALEWSQAQIDTAKAAVRGINRELSELEGFKGYLVSLGENGIAGSLLELMGFDDNAISAFGSAVDTVIGYLQEIADAEAQLAEKAVEAAEKRVDAAREAYDAEIEARNNGYANSVATAKKELEQEKKKQQQKQKLLEQAQRRQEALNAIMQAGSLITASANLWSSFSSVPIVGPILAATAIAAMWTSFAIAKVKARQVTASSEAYGEGGLEFLEGGSHASGNDINLGTRNKKGKRMRAEGGEALAIISRKQTKRYRKVLPDIIDSLNKGIFEDKYIRAFDNSEGISLFSMPGEGANLSKLESDVQSIRKQNEKRYFSLPDGTVVIQHKNVTRKIKS